MIQTLSFCSLNTQVAALTLLVFPAVSVPCSDPVRVLDPYLSMHILLCTANWTFVRCVQSRLGSSQIQDALLLCSSDLLHSCDCSLVCSSSLAASGGLALAVVPVTGASMVLAGHCRGALFFFLLSGNLQARPEPPRASWHT